MLYGAMNFPVRDLMSELETIRDMGFDLVELSMDPPKADYESVGPIASDIVSFLSDNGMGLICHLPTFVCLADLSRNIREASVQDTLKSMETAKRLNAWKLTLHPPYFQGLGKFTPDLVHKLGLESMARIAEAAKELEIDLCVENMAPNSFSLGTPAQFHDLFESFPEFKLTLDVGHANLGPGGFNRTITFIKQFEDKIGHIHMSDNFGKQDNHLPIGAGIIDYPNILKALSATSFNGAITLEVFSKDKEFLLLSRKKIHGMWRDNKKE